MTNRVSAPHTVDSDPALDALVDPVSTVMRSNAATASRSRAVVVDKRRPLGASH